MVEEARRAPGFVGAFFHGSIGEPADDAPLPVTSDVDLVVVMDMSADVGAHGRAPVIAPGKRRYDGVLLDVSIVGSEQVASPEQVLGRYDLAGSFRWPSVIADPTGRLTPLQEAIGRAFAQRQWVRARCADAEARLLRHLATVDPTAPLHEAVTGWLFGAGVMTHVLLVAGLRNPTVRKRYLYVRELLTDYGRLDYHEPLLELPGCRDMTREQVEAHLAALEETFDAAAAAIRTPFFFASDLSAIARPLAIDGSRELIAASRHREAVFWIVATSSRCQAVFRHDAPELAARFEQPYRRLLGDLGITTSSDLARRRDEVRRGLPQLRDVTDAILVANPEIADEPSMPV